MVSSKVLLCKSLCEKICLVKGQRYDFDDDAITILDTKVRTKLMVSDGNVLGSGSETRRISSGQNFGCPIILKDCADSGNSITVSQVEFAINF